MVFCYWEERAEEVFVIAIGRSEWTGEEGGEVVAIDGREEVLVVEVAHVVAVIVIHRKVETQTHQQQHCNGQGTHDPRFHQVGHGGCVGGVSKVIDGLLRGFGGSVGGCWMVVT